MKVVPVLLLWLIGASLTLADLEWAETSYRAQVPPNEERISTSFAFRNAGNEEIHIEGTKLTCGCTTVELEKRDYAPGESGAIAAVLDVGALSGAEITRYIYVLYRVGEEQRQARLEFTGVVPEYVRQSANSLGWNVGEPATSRKVVFTVLHDEPIHLGDLQVSEPGFDVKLHATVPGRAYELVVTPESTAIANQKASIRLNSDFPADKPFAFHVFVRVRPNPVQVHAWQTWRDRLLRLLF